MKTNRLLLLIFTVLPMFTSCESEDDLAPVPGEEQGNYTDGIFILNEGVFGSGNASISYIDPQHELITHNVFREANSGALLGDTGQSMAFYEDYAFIVVNVSNKIEIVDRHSFESIATIDQGLENPRYITFSGGKAFVTNWGDGSDPADDYVAVISPQELQVTGNIPVAEGPERILEHQGHLYVVHKGGWSFNNRISVIDDTDYEVQEITVGDLPNSLVISDGYLWVASSGLPDYSGEESPGSIHKIDLESLEVVSELEFGSASNHPANLQSENGQIYFTLGTDLYRFNPEDQALPDEVFMDFSEVAILYGLNIKNGLIYAASASSTNNADGALFIYDIATESLLYNFDTAINPNGVYFNR